MHKEEIPFFVVFGSLFLLLGVFMIYNSYDDAFYNAPYIQVPSLAFVLFVPLLIILFLFLGFWNKMGCALQSIGGLFFIAQMFCMYFMCYNEDSIEQKTTTNQKIVVIPAILKNKPVFFEDHDHENGVPSHLQLYFKNLPEYEYKFQPFHKDKNDNLWLRTNIGDTVYLELSKREYEIKIAKTKAPTFKEKHFDWNEIYIIGLSNRNFKVGCKYCYEGDKMKLR